MTDVQYPLTEPIRAGVLAALDAGWSYDAIADSSGVAKQTIYDFATERTAGINSRSLDALAVWLGVRATRVRVPARPERDPRGRQPPGRPPKSAVSRTQVSK